VVDRHFWSNTRKLKIKTLPPFLRKDTPVSSQLSVWAGSKLIKKKESME
jgi:hypothetical protein